jgi:hypothetical protein
MIAVPHPPKEAKLPAILPAASDFLLADAGQQSDRRKQTEEATQQAT